MRGHHDEIDIRLLGPAPNDSAELHAIHLRHVPIGDDDGMRGGLQCFPGLPPVCGRVRCVAGCSHNRGKLYTGDRVIVNDQNLNGRHAWYIGRMIPVFRP